MAIALFLTLLRLLRWLLRLLFLLLLLRRRRRRYGPIESVTFFRIWALVSVRSIAVSCHFSWSSDVPPSVIHDVLVAAGRAYDARAVRRHRHEHREHT